MDALSEVLRVVKLRGAVFFHAQCHAPWTVLSPPSEAFRKIIGTPTTDVIEFHFLVEGRATVKVGGESTPLSAGDVILLPHGDGHVLGNGQGGEIVHGESDLAAVLRGELALARLGGDGEESRLVCGYLVCESALFRPVITGLPRLVRVHLRSDPYGRLLEDLVRHAVDHASVTGPGGEATTARLAELLFSEALRRHTLQQPPGRTGWLAAACDPALGKALAALHRQPERAWTLDELAQRASMSRSAFSERFTARLGQSPMVYLAEWRLALAAEALRSTRRSVIEIAGDVGYESEAAFNRAFKRRFSVPPGRYRRAAVGNA